MIVQVLGQVLCSHCLISYIVLLNFLPDGGKKKKNNPRLEDLKLCA